MQVKKFGNTESLASMYYNTMSHPVVTYKYGDNHSFVTPFHSLGLLWSVAFFRRFLFLFFLGFTRFLLGTRGEVWGRDRLRRGRPFRVLKLV